MGKTDGTWPAHSSCSVCTTCSVRLQVAARNERSREIAAKLREVAGPLERGGGMQVTEKIAPSTCRLLHRLATEIESEV